MYSLDFVESYVRFLNYQERQRQRFKQIFGYNVGEKPTRYDLEVVDGIAIIRPVAYIVEKH